MIKKFNWRAFTSLYIVISFLIIGVSGLILFIAPPGRIANWTNLIILGLTKSQWQAIHTVFTFLFILAAAVHIYFNWRPLIAYLRTRAQQTIHIRKELISSGILVCLLVLLTLQDAPPFSNLMKLSEDLSYSWSAPETEPPIPHAELLTIEEIAERTGKPLEKLTENLNDAGFEISETTMTLSQLASARGISPQELYKTMVKLETAEPLTGTGYGRMTVRAISEKFDIPLDQCLLRLKQKGIETDANMILRDLADRIGMHPHEILTIIRDS